MKLWQPDEDSIEDKLDRYGLCEIIAGIIAGAILMGLLWWLC